MKNNRNGQEARRSYAEQQNLKRPNNLLVSTSAEILLERCTKLGTSFTFITEIRDRAANSF
ncbi:MAG: hypothetical protein KME25_18130 [Symplocastrum torsivum CPER-KK1]|jgi:hypothetical protein|uniref:Uncharacterized protein n=1 Tax=Symplocastrum torsivum CPER-KK1 TaxID=450513 RepID=A0A951UAX9_9CYAN|nr:hypothetical protein [Symplocastrum torsivum CPER-KK1]